MSRIRLLTVATLLILWWLVESPSADHSNFVIIDKVKALDSSHSHYLKLFLNIPEVQPIPYWIRSLYDKTPGDYFRPPEGASRTSLSEGEVTEIESTLTKAFTNSLYDHFIIDSLEGFEYFFSDGKIHRREYHIYYAQGDTIYVISGWLGKFLSFYRAVPGDFRYSIDELQNEVRKISPSYKIADSGSFKRIDEKQNYFLEYVDRENMTRVRNYLIYGTFIFPGKTEGENKRYNLIEVTRFIDKEVIP